MQFCIKKNPRLSICTGYSRNNMYGPPIIPLLLLYDQILPLLTTLNIDFVQLTITVTAFNKELLLEFNKECAQITPTLTLVL